MGHYTGARACHTSLVIGRHPKALKASVQGDLIFTRVGTRGRQEHLHRNRATERESKAKGVQGRNRAWRRRDACEKSAKHAWQHGLRYGLLYSLPTMYGKGSLVAPGPGISGVLHPLLRRHGPTQCPDPPATRRGGSCVCRIDLASGSQREREGERE